MNLGRFALVAAEAAYKRREARALRLKEIVLARFEPTADQRFCLRRTEIVGAVAAGMGEVANNDTHAEVRRLAAELGLEAVVNGGRALYRCVKRRGETEAEALATSRAVRHDSRTRRK